MARTLRRLRTTTITGLAESRPNQTSHRHVDCEAGEQAPLIASLRERLVVLGPDLVVSRKASDVTDDAYDRLPGKQRPESHTTANGIGIRPISCGHRLVDDDDWRRSPPCQTE